MATLAGPPRITETGSHAARGRAVARRALVVAMLAVVYLAAADASAAAQQPTPTNLRVVPGVGSLSPSWSVTSTDGLVGFRVRWRLRSRPKHPWSKGVELGAGARSYEITGLNVASYQVGVSAWVVVTKHRSGRRRAKGPHRFVRKLGGTASDVAAPLRESAEVDPFELPPPTEQPSPGAQPARLAQPLVQQLSPSPQPQPDETPAPEHEAPQEEPSPEEPPPHEEPPHEEPPHEEPPHEEPPGEEPPLEEPPHEEPPVEEPPVEEPPHEEPHEEPPHEEPPHEEPPGSGCTLYGSPSGSDGNSGKQAAPIRTVQHLLEKLTAGQTGCLAPGSYAGFSVHGGQSHGGPGAPVTITSRDPQQPATISGRVATLPGADWLTFSHLVFVDSEVKYPSVSIGSAHTSWLWSDVSAPDTICFATNGPGSYGPAEDTLIEHDRIHDCGQPFSCESDSPPCNQPPNDGYFIHGVYDLGVNTTVLNSYVYDNSSKGVLLRGGHGAVVEHNVIDGNGSGVALGDLKPEGATVAWNIVTNSGGPCGSCLDYFGIWSSGEVGAGNVVEHNDVFGNQSGNFGATKKRKLKDNIQLDPLYTELTAHDYVLAPQSPVLGYGPE